MEKKTTAKLDETKAAVKAAEAKVAAKVEETKTAAKEAPTFPQPILQTVPFSLGNKLPEWR